MGSHRSVSHTVCVSKFLNMSGSFTGVQYVYLLWIQIMVEKVYLWWIKIQIWLVISHGVARKQNVRSESGQIIHVQQSFSILNRAIFEEIQVIQVICSKSLLFRWNVHFFCRSKVQFFCSNVLSICSNVPRREKMAYFLCYKSISFFHL